MKHLFLLLGTRVGVSEATRLMFLWIARMTSPVDFVRCEALWFVPLEYPALAPDLIGVPEECICFSC